MNLLHLGQINLGVGNGLPHQGRGEFLVRQAIDPEAVIVELFVESLPAIGQNSQGDRWCRRPDFQGLFLPGVHADEQEGTKPFTYLAKLLFGERLMMDEPHDLTVLPTDIVHCGDFLHGFHGSTLAFPFKIVKPFSGFRQVVMDIDMVKLLDVTSEFALDRGFTNPV